MDYEPYPICYLFIYLFVVCLFNFSIEDGIVLSPQRQSFVQGCQIPQSAPERNNQQERVKTGLSRTSDRDREGRSRLTGRVGRGRALDYKERTPLQERNKVKLLNCYWLFLLALHQTLYTLIMYLMLLQQLLLSIHVERHLPFAGKIYSILILYISPVICVVSLTSHRVLKTIKK